VSTSTLTARTRTPMSAPFAFSPTRRIFIVFGIHVFYAAVCLWALWNVASGTWELESIPRTVIGVGAGVVLVLNILAAAMLMRRKSFGRSLSIGINYLSAILIVVTLFQSLDLATYLDEFAGAFNRAFIPFIGIAIAGTWLVLVRRLKVSVENAAQHPHEFGTPVFIRTTWWIGVTGVAVLGAVWIWQLDVPLLWSIFTELFAANGLYNTTLIVALAILLWATMIMWSGVIAQEFNTRSDTLEAQAGWLFLSPNLIGFLLFFAGPLVFSLVISFYEWDGITEATFVGFGNYIETLGLSFSTGAGDPAAGYQWIVNTPLVNIAASDPLFWRAIFNISLFLVVAVPLAVVPALILATLINNGYRGTKTFRTIFFVPAVAGVIGVTLIWKQMLNSTVGFVNWVIATFNGFVNAILPGNPLPDPVEIGWLSDPSVALWAVMLVFAWSQFGFNTVLFTAGMQGVPKELHEAAELDGAGSLKRFFSITLPTLRATTFFVIASTVILALQLFDIVYALNQPNPVGFPDNATLTPVVYLYQLGFQQSAFGQASAVAWVLFIFIFSLTLLQFRRQRKYSEEN
jgi:ABC-type sugar transport system permease subunit